MEELNFPKYKFNINKGPKGWLIFDKVRRKNIVLTPEEWVRQHLVEFLISEKYVPPTLMRMEMPLTVHQLSRRPDLVVYNSFGEPVIIAECKAPNIKISQNVFEQIAQYNLKLKVPYLMVTNGLTHYYCFADFNTKSIKFIPELPSYHEL